MANRKTLKMTRQAVLDHLGDGHGVNEIARMYGYKGPSTINRWRRDDADFNGAVMRILSSPQHQRRMAAAGVAVGEPVVMDTKERWLIEYRKERDRTKACDMVGIEPTELAAWLSPESPEYDHEFVSKMDNENLRDSWKAEDVAKNKAIINQDGNMLRFVLPVLAPGSYGKVHQQKATGNTLVNIFASDKLADTASFLERLFGSTTDPAGDARALQAARSVTGGDDRSGEVSGLLDAVQV